MIRPISLLQFMTLNHNSHVDEGHTIDFDERLEDEWLDLGLSSYGKFG